MFERTTFFVQRYIHVDDTSDLWLFTLYLHSFFSIHAEKPDNLFYKTARCGVHHNASASILCVDIAARADASIFSRKNKWAIWLFEMCDLRIMPHRYICSWCVPSISSITFTPITILIVHPKVVGGRGVVRTLVTSILHVLSQEATSSHCAPAARWPRSDNRTPLYPACLLTTHPCSCCYTTRCTHRTAIHHSLHSIRIN